MVIIIILWFSFVALFVCFCIIAEFLSSLFWENFSVCLAEPSRILLLSQCHLEKEKENS